MSLADYLSFHQYIFQALRGYFDIYSTQLKLISTCTDRNSDYIDLYLTNERKLIHQKSVGFENINQGTHCIHTRENM